MAEQRSTNGPDWVREEILASLARVGSLLREGGDTGEAVTLLFEMRAMLMARALPAAALLAEEMQRTCEQILKDATVDAGQARAALSSAIAQLTEHLRAGDAGEQPDPLALLPSINDLRHARGVPPLSPADLLIPSSVPAQSEPVAPDSLAALVRLSLKVRPHFHRYLVRWFSDDNAQAGLLGLSRLFNHVRRNFKQGPVHQLFLAAESLVDGLLDGHLEADAPTKALLGRLDKVLKPLTAPAPEWPADLATALLGDLSSRISQLPADTAAMQELERRYGRGLSEHAQAESTGVAPAAPTHSAVTQRAPAAGQASAADKLREARAKLGSARSAVGIGAMSLGQSAQLADTYRTLQGLAASLGNIGETEPARLLDALAAQLRIRYLEPSQVPGEAGVELIGRALAAVDIYLEDRLEREVTDVRMIAEADYAIERLSGLLRPDKEVDGDSEAADSLPWTEASQSVNLEFLNLFLDEAQDELESIRLQQERWSRDRQDDLALSILRRSFQTLKNSGKLVGARHLADLARYTGAVLERLLDRDLPADVAAADFLADVVALLPEIIEAESQRRKAPTASLIRSAKTLLAAADNTGSDSEAPMRMSPPGADTAAAGASASEHEAPDGSAASPSLAAAAAEPGEVAGAARSDAGAAARSAGADDDDVEALLAGDDPLPVFVHEAGELIEALDVQLRDWLAGGPDAAGLALARRRLHNLKGSARMAGLAPVGDLSHALESLLADAENLPAANTNRLLDLVQRSLDTLSGQISAAGRGEPVVLPDKLFGEIAAAGPDAHAAGTQITPETPPAAADTPEAAEAPAAAGDDAATQLRVDADWLDGIINRSGEVGEYRARLMQQNARLGFRLAQLEALLKRVTRRLDALDALGEPALTAAGDDTGERTRTLSEAAALLGESRTVTAAVGELQRDNADLLRQQMRIAESLQDDLLSARMLPFGRLQARLARLVRVTADALGKRVQLALTGADVMLDRNVLERFTPPLEHLLRNAVVHGIEPPSTRAAGGKPRVGEVRIALTREGNDVIFDIVDDGAGIDAAKVRERAVALGLVAADAQLPESEVLALTLRAGFSTAEALTQEAGRGIGLDVVSTQVAALNGELTLSSTPGRGMRARVRLPLTLSIVEALLVNAADTLLAVPHGTALAVTRVAREHLLAGGAEVEYRGERFPVEPLERALSPAAVPSPPQQRWLPVLLVAAGGERIAFQVDALLASQRVMVKPLGPPLAALRWLSGGTVLPDGRVALLADLPALLRARRQPDSVDAAAEQHPTVLVVDDSETVRRVAQRLLARESLTVVTARDGVEAQVMLRRRRPDLLLVDLDMPRMNGLELTRWVRGADDLRRLPIVMITSMVGETQRAEALAAGVDRFVSKPFAEDALLAQIEALLLTGGA
ncbi:hypothetical protein CKO31_10660 [Thiohalocapsa halophila]|uniref:histidine kinase n=1 Tax=Thiohalocapsa halophila TaxID=69359 RepID=A0ABS1CGZ3_9GAMM|nr:response regulator [Thiohalocapsa halophila]MBK1631191.1 hypothetical protein [Thiohalocapsa halophila]